MQFHLITSFSKAFVFIEIQCRVHNDHSLTFCAVNNMYFVYIYSVDDKEETILTLGLLRDLSFSLMYLIPFKRCLIFLIFLFSILKYIFVNLLLVIFFKSLKYRTCNLVDSSKAINYTKQIGLQIHQLKIKCIKNWGSNSDLNV